MRKILFLTGLIVFSFFFTGEIKADTETLRPDSNGHAGNSVFTRVGGGTANWEAVDEVSTDDNTTYLYGNYSYHGYGDGWETFALGDSTGSGYINSVTVYYRTAGIVLGGAGEYYGSGAWIYTNGASYNQPDPGQRTNTSYVTYSYTWAINPATGVAWTWDEIDSLEAGVTLAGAAWKGKATQVYVEVDYNTPVVPTITDSNGATAITQVSARLNGEVTDTGGENPTVYIYWGDNDGGINPANWDHEINLGTKGAETFYTDIDGLTSGITYYYRTYAVNFAGDDWANETTHFVSLIPCQTHNVSGYSWSENIGWISFSCKNESNLGDYGVDINSVSGEFSGHAWSENIGWISFDRADTGAPPAQPYKGVGTSYIAKMDTNTGEVTGWARALSFGDGWEGWIKLSDTNYGVLVSLSTGDFSGYAWSDMVIGWINFKGVDYKVTTTFSLNNPPDKPGIPDIYKPSGVVLNNCSFKDKSIPTFSWTYSDPDSNPQAAYEIWVDDNSSFNDPKFNYLVNVSATSYTLILNQDDDSDWISELAWDSTYFWKVRVKDNQGNWSEWSDSNSFKTPKHAYPWPDFTFFPVTPIKGQIVIFNPEEEEVNYLWTVTQGSEEYVDSTGPTSEEPHIKFLEISNKIKLKVTDSEPYSCESPEQEITASLPLPKYKEVSPSAWFEKFFAAIARIFNIVEFRY